MWNDFYDEPSEFDQLVEEFKNSLRLSIKEEFIREIECLRKENESLREIRDNWNAKVGELEKDYANKNRELDKAIREANDAAVNAKELRFKELVDEVAPVVWTIEYEVVRLPKCNLCDEDRYRDYITPLGRAAKEECECAVKKRIAHVKRAPILRIEELGRSMLRTYYLTCDDDHSTYNRDSYEFCDDTPFEKINTWRRPLFHDENRARRYAAWLNKKNNVKG